jgi:type IV pilus assembly protein PilB
MIDMGLEPFNVAAALNLITAQRLLRRICKKCKVEAKYSDETLEAAKLPAGWLEKHTLYKGEGCDKCDGTGYKGRQGLYEVMAMSTNLRKLIMQEAGTDELREAAVSEGMLTLRMDGIKKLERGVTTLDEVMKETSAGN